MMMLKSNFKFINGKALDLTVRDEKGVITNKEWRVESNINKKILKPTKNIQNCKKTLDDMQYKNETFFRYLEMFRPSK